MESQLALDVAELKRLSSKIIEQVDAKMLQLQKREELYSSQEKIIEKFTKNKVKLDVGGKIFSVSLSTLTSEDSFFSAMFSGRFKLEKDEDNNAYFIDRNPRYFEVILDYLRTGKIQFSKFTKEELAELEEEVNFYQIPSLVRLFANLECSFDPKRSFGFVLSEHNTKAVCTGHCHSLVVACSPSSEWQIYLGQTYSPYDHVGFYSQKEVLNGSISAGGVWLRDNQLEPVRHINMQQGSPARTGDTVKFSVDGTGLMSVWVNEKPLLQYQLPHDFGPVVPAFSSFRENSWVKISPFT